MTGKELAQFSDPFRSDRRVNLGSRAQRRPRPAQPLDLTARPRRGLVLSLRSGLYALAYLLAGALIFIFFGLCSIDVLLDEHCGPAFGYFGCAIPVEGLDFHAPSAAVGQLGI